MITHQKGFGQIIYLILILIGVAAVGVYYYLTSKGVSVETNNPTYTQRIPDSKPEETEAWKTFKSETLGIEYQLPAVIHKFNIVEKKVEGVDGGHVICTTSEPIKQINTCHRDVFTISAVSKDYGCGCGGDFTMNEGYITKNGKFYVDDYEYPQNLVKEIENPNKVKILIVSGKTLYSHNPWYPPEGRIGAIINNPNSTYSAVVIDMILDTDLTVDLFDQILSTFRFLK